MFILNQPFILSEFSFWRQNLLKFIKIYFFNYFRVEDELMYSDTESRAFKLDNNYYEGSMSAIVSDIDDDKDVFYCYVTFGNLPLNLTTHLISSAMRPDSLRFYIILAPIILMLGSLKPLLSTYDYRLQF